MSKEVIECPVDVQNAIKNVQSDRSPEEWIVLGYSDQRTLCVLGTGTGQLDACIPYLVDGREAYALVRYVHKIEISRNIKFGFVNWIPETIRPMRKSLLSTHAGQVQKVLEPIHVSVTWSEVGEIIEAEILEKIGMASGTKNSEISEEKASQIREKEERVKANPGALAGKAAVRSFVPRSAQKEQTTFSAGDDVKQALKDIRNDNCPLRWVITGYEGGGGHHIVVLQSGEGDVDELVQHIDNSLVQYCLFRVDERYDERTTNVKFGFIKVIPQSIRPTRRGIVGTHKGAVERAFHNYHVDFTVDGASEISQAEVMDKITSQSGTKSNVTKKAESKIARHRKEEAWRKVPSHLPKGHKAREETKLQFEDGSALLTAIRAVHSDTDDTDWVLGEVNKSKVIRCLGSGMGGVDALKACLTGNITFGLVRITEQIDKSTTTKFVYLYFQPPTINPIARAKAGTIKGVIADLFQPWHVDFFVDDPADITESIVADKVAAASGTKSNITSKSSTPGLRGI